MDERVLDPSRGSIAPRVDSLEFSPNLREPGQSETEYALFDNGVGRAVEHNLVAGCVLLNQPHQTVAVLEKSEAVVVVLDEAFR